MRRASGYRVAMHDTCIACHEKEKERTGRPKLADCSTCHLELRYREPTGLEREAAARSGQLQAKSAAMPRDVAILVNAN
jgi:hypothetical protein